MSADKTNWTKVVADCVEAMEREHVASAARVVDHEIVPISGGAADEIAVWLICRDREERTAFVDSELSRFRSELSRRLLAAGFAENALASLIVRATSRDEMAARGGRLSRL